MAAVYMFIFLFILSWFTVQSLGSLIAFHVMAVETSAVFTHKYLT